MDSGTKVISDNLIELINKLFPSVSDYCSFCQRETVLRRRALQREVNQPPDK